MQAKLDGFLLIVEREIAKAEKNYIQAKKDALEVAASGGLSPSQAGGRVH